ncbi:MAG: phosphopantothenoylcysteine decarboxylase [Verrucomicrobiota bacterium]
MHCVVTAGPTYEPLDEVRRLTNFSTGKLGSQLGDFLVAHGHQVTLLYGYYATCHEPQKAQRIIRFDTTTDLRTKLELLAKEKVDAVFHAAAVSDFAFGKIWERTATGELREAKSGKISTRDGTLFAELVPTQKIIRNLRRLFPDACIVGWKYEVEGDRASVIEKAAQQIQENRTNGCVANGKAYGFGFGLVTADKETSHFSDTGELFAALETLARTPRL